MFSYQRIKHLRVKQGLFGQEIWIKYGEDQEMFLTSGLVDMEDFEKKQGVYVRISKREVLEKAKLRA
jgi:uncharacterized membrane protein YobD (UPF0266 family)